VKKDVNLLRIGCKAISKRERFPIVWLNIGVFSHILGDCSGVPPSGFARFIEKFGVLFKDPGFQQYFSRLPPS
jgi:hypothetical protein